MRPELSIEPEFLLPAPCTLRLYLEGEVFFSSNKHWLHPLFDLQAFFAGEGAPAGAVLVDRVTGLGAAFLVANLGIRQLRTQLLSRLAIPVLERHGIEVRCKETVAKVACATEDLLAGIQATEEACALLRIRREQALAGT
jgi:zinc transport system ATP-binding protein